MYIDFYRSNLIVFIHIFNHKRAQDTDGEAITVLSQIPSDFETRSNTHTHLEHVDTTGGLDYKKKTERN